jgi:sigma-B regulation protein RsbQ
MLFAHGFGCDQQAWRFVAPAFADDHRVVCFDHAGCGRSDLRAYDERHHAALDGYAADLVEIVEALDLRDVVFVGHSAGATIGILASIIAPSRFARLVLVGASARYLNDPPDYFGGFERADVDALIDMMDRSLLGWANVLAPLMMGDGHAPALTDELRSSLCAGDPYTTRRFALATFLGDHRADLPKVAVPSLLIRCSDDAIVPPSAGDDLHARLGASTLHTLEGSGHCPHMSQPQEVVELVRGSLRAA